MTGTKSFPSSRRAGFTLIESLIVVALIMILALFTIPALLNMVERNKLEGTTRQASSMIQLARLNAIKTGANTTVQGDTAKRTVVVLAGTRQISTMTLPTGILFGPTAYTAVLRPDGSVATIGAIEFRSQKNTSNRMRVQIEPQATARAVVQKWDVTRNAFIEAPWKWY